MDRLGMSVSDLLRIRGGKLGVSTIRNIGLQVLRKLVAMHELGIVHNDIKPDNLLFGLREDRNKVYIVDFGLATLVDGARGLLEGPESGNKDRRGGFFVGNVRFAAVGKLRGEHAQQVQDLEGLMYVLLWLLFGGNCIWEQANSGRHVQECFCQVCEMCLNQRIQTELSSKLNFIENSINPWLADRDVIFSTFTSDLF
jgi:casein kinase 1